MDNIKRLQQLAGIDETKITSKKYGTFQATEKNDHYIYGNLTIRRDTFPAFIELGHNRQDLIFVSVDPEEHDILVPEYEEKLKSAKIKYELDQSNEDYSFFMIPAKENNIKIIDNIDETKIGPKLPPITLKGTAHTSITWYPEDFETYDEFREFRNKLETDDEFRYDVFFDNKDNENLSWDISL